MFLLEVEDLEASCEVIVFPQTAEKAGDLVRRTRCCASRARRPQGRHTEVVAMELAEPDYSVLDNPLRIRVRRPTARRSSWAS